MKQLMTILTLSALVLGTEAASQIYIDTHYDTIVSESLGGEERSILFHVPSECTEESPCPVIVFLPGWTQTPGNFVFMRTQMANLMNGDPAIRPVIVVVPDGSGGIYTRSMYWDSPVNGNFGTYVAEEVVQYIDENYPVIKGPGDVHERDAYILAGFSMGGGGAGRLGYLRGDTFSGIAAFSGELFLENVWDFVPAINGEARPGPVYTPPNPAYSLEYTFWGLASAFSPNGEAPYLADFPLEEYTGEIIDSVRERWVVGDAVYQAENYYQTYDVTSMSLLVSAGQSDYLYSFSLDFANWLGVNYPEAPLYFFDHPYGHAFNDPLNIELLEWADDHFASLWTVSVNESVPCASALRNYPNPFNPQTTISFDFEVPQKAVVAICDAAGHVVTVIADRQFAAGSHTLTWNGRDSQGRAMPGGTYIVRLETEEGVEAGKVMLVR